MWPLKGLIQILFTAASVKITFGSNSLFLSVLKADVAERILNIYIRGKGDIARFVIKDCFNAENKAVVIKGGRCFN